MKSNKRTSRDLFNNWVFDEVVINISILIERLNI